MVSIFAREHTYEYLYYGEHQCPEYEAAQISHDFQREHKVELIYLDGVIYVYKHKDVYQQNEYKTKSSYVIVDVSMRTLY